MAQSDPNRVLRALPLVAGALGGLTLLINRGLTPVISTPQSRSDALGILLSAVLILVGLLWQQVQPRSPEAVELDGEEVFELAPELPDALQTELAWASHQLLINTVTRSLVIYYQDQVLLRRGILPPKPDVTPKAILKRVMAQEKPIYLVALTLYPGRIEFDYLPANTQGLICQPLGSQGALILGANAPRSYTQQDERWIAGIADKLAHTLAIAFPTP
ncbi:cofactor assembly of complex C subunit B [Spirulina major CS-329]|uniref:cofactor assembly of complex C subunit B n=1 Tax=Spirulina TaxID=1154 RepID=UPI00232F3D3B|nr:MULTISPECIES: cofactor assembly of complex C subunit B [Spirulina]MDB9495459.1 cofactor assembly of complex C subunit B [Spirulina subsalsa CS-330]MDB9505104.1 cofactor assembly of complex C subunit B [Spirulina major CS-329]